jgi:hypothetical protein
VQYKMCAVGTNKQYAVKPVHVSCRGLSNCQQRTRPVCLSVCLSRSDTMISSTVFTVALSRSPQSATNVVERRISSRSVTASNSVAASNSVTASNSVAATWRYGKTDHHSRTDVTLNFEPAHKCPTKSLFTKLVRLLLSFVNYLVVHVFHARMREMVHRGVIDSQRRGLCRHYSNSYRRR